MVNEIFPAPAARSCRVAPAELRFEMAGQPAIGFGVAGGPGGAGRGAERADLALDIVGAAHEPALLLDCCQAFSSKYAKWIMRTSY